MTDNSGSYICTACGWIYDPTQGDPDGGIAPGTRWEDIPSDWICPVCGVGKEEFEPVTDHAASVSATPAGPSPRSEQKPIVIVGSGLAGYTLAKELRKQDANCRLIIVTADGGEAYTKPMLSNAFARHHQAEDMVQKDAVQMATELKADVIIRSRVVSIDRQAHCLVIEDSCGTSTLVYGRLVLAVGADPRVFPAEGSDAVVIATVNDLDDYRRWREKIGDQGRILLIGAGLIGCEFANDLTSGGFQVAMVDPAPWPLSRLLPEQIGNMLTGALQQQGCELHLGRSVSRYQTVPSGFIAVLDDGSEIAFDHALSAVGLTARTALAKDAGLEVAAGILIDRQMRTSDPDIFALGDCAQTGAGPLPFIAPLLAEAKALAATLCGQQTTLVLPALPVVVKTPALPLVLCPPAPGASGEWKVEMGQFEAIALFRDSEGRELGFALAGNKTSLHQELARRMPPLLPCLTDSAPLAEDEKPRQSANKRYACEVCGHIYDPAEGDPDSGIAPGTAWEEIPDDWVCPVCGVGKDQFLPI